MLSKQLFLTLCKILLGCWIEFLNQRFAVCNFGSFRTDYIYISSYQDFVMITDSFIVFFPDKLFPHFDGDTFDISIV